MHGGQVSQARRKFHVGSGLQPASLIGVQPRSLDSCPLTRDPVWCEKAAEARSVLVESPK